MLKFGGDLLQAAAFHGKAEIVDMFVEKGADIHNPPEDISGDDSYRRTPHVITACISGDIPTLEAVLRAGGAINEKGFITFSKKRKNLVSSNVIGAAAYWGKTRMLSHLLTNCASSYLNFEATEELDRKAAKDTKFQKEMAKYTPLMLCVAKGDENLDCVRLLLQYHADYQRKDSFDNTLLHIAALNGNNRILDYIAKNLKLDLLERNKNGDTALSICTAQKNTEGEEILQKYSAEYDTSKNLAADLLDQLEREEEKEEKAKAQRKLKKWRNKINKLAKQLNISPEEVEERLQKEEVEKQQREKEEQKRLEEKAKQEELNEIRRKEEVRRQAEELRRQEELREERERRRQEQIAREEAEERRRAQQLIYEEQQRIREQQRLERQERAARRQSQRRETETTEQKKERVKSTQRPAAQTEREVRQPRHADTPRGKTPVQREKSQRVASKSMTKDEVDNENKLNQTTNESKVFGLSGEMALTAAQSKKAQQRLKKKMDQEHKQEEERQAAIVRAAEERLIAKRQAEDEERKRLA